MSLFWGILQPAPPPPLAPGQHPLGALVHPSLAGQEGWEDAFVCEKAKNPSSFPFHLTHQLMVFLYTPTATETCSQGVKIV